MTHSGTRAVITFRQSPYPWRSDDGPYHYKRAEEMLVEIEAAHAVPNETEAALATCAQAHAILALAAATAINPGLQRHDCTTSQAPRMQTSSDRAIGPAAAAVVNGPISVIYPHLRPDIAEVRLDRSWRRYAQF